MNRLKIDILGVSETWWTDCGAFKSQNVSVYHSGNMEGIHRRGVGIIVQKHIAACVIGYYPMSERTMVIKISAKPLNMNIIQVYAPSCDRNNDEVEHFYEEIAQLLKMTKSHEITIIQGDFNAKVGSDEVDGVTGRYGLGERNDRGDRLIQFCQEFKMSLTNTLFQLHPRRLYTWRSPLDNRRNVVRNQIDYILINNRFKSSVTKCSTYPGADVPSDHNLLMLNMRIKIARIQKANKKSHRINTEALKNPSTRNEVKEQINNRLEVIDREDTENIWKNVKDTMINITKSYLEDHNRRTQEEWMTEEIMELRTERSRYRNVDFERYWETNKEVRTAIRAAKNELLNRQCQEIEYLQSIHDDYNLHKKLKEASGAYRRISPAVLIDENNQPIFESQQIKNHWKNYIKKLFTDEHRSRYDHNLSNNVTGTPITESEVEYAIQTLKDKKATGPDEIPSEILKLIEGNNISLITRLFNHVYDTGQYPNDWLKSTFIAIPKKSNAKKCSEYRLISLMCHILKIFLRIIHRRIYSKCEGAMGESQFGFKEGMGTREALLSIQVLVQKCKDVQKDVYICFIDYEKAFDTVQHDKLIEILRDTGIEEKEIRCIRNLYWNQTAVIQINGELTEEIPISKGVRQGCILSPLLFNIYSQKIFQDSIEKEKIGIRVQGKIVNNIRYADDTIIFASSMSGLQKLLDKLTYKSETYGLKINIKKTKYMVISRKQGINETTLKIKDEPVDRVKNFKYLGVLLNDQWNSNNEIKRRMEMARDAFGKYKKTLTNHEINLATKIRFVKCYIWSALLYAVETWTIKSADEKKIEAFEMWIYRRILKIPYTSHTTNEEVLRRMHTDRQLLHTVKRRKVAYLGHLMRNDKYEFVQSIIKCTIEGCRSRGRREMYWLKNIQDWTKYRDETNIIYAAKFRELTKLL